MKHADTMLNTWIEDQNQCHVPVSMLLVQAKARSIYEDLSESDDSVKLFNRFMKRYNFYNIKILGKLLLLTGCLTPYRMKSTS
jgi:hypothetical protein